MHMEKSRLIVFKKKRKIDNEMEVEFLKSLY